MSDVIALLEQDHRRVEQLFAQIKEAQGNGRARLVTELVEALTIHMQVEESLVYPFIAKQVDEGGEMVEEAEEEHKGARTAMKDVDRLSPDEPGFDGALEMLEAGISHHVEEEEGEVFPKLRRSADATALDDLGRKVEAAKMQATSGKASSNGSDDVIDLRSMSKDELYQRAQEAKVPGRSSMTKDQLIDALAGQAAR